MLDSLATVCAKLGKLDDVKKHCDDALKIDEKNFKALVRRGMNYVELKDFDAGEADYKAAAAIQPDSTSKSLSAFKRVGCAGLIERVSDSFEACDERAEENSQKATRGRQESC